MASAGNLQPGPGVAGEKGSRRKLENVGAMRPEAGFQPMEEEVAGLNTLNPKP